MLELHQFQWFPVPLSNLALERRIAQLEVRARRRANVCRQRFARAFVNTVWMIKEEFRKTARGEPWETTEIAETPESKTTIAVEAVPAKKGRLSLHTGHRLDGVAHEFGNMPDDLHHRNNIRHAAPSRRT